jgi:hypothetical protein
VSTSTQLGWSRRASIAAAAAVMIALPLPGIRAASASPGPPPPNLRPRTLATATSTSAVHWGTYVGPGSKGVAGARAFAAWSGLPITDALDFSPTSNWTEITRTGWLLTPYAGTGLRLEYSLPMLPDTTGVSLADCAAGKYDDQWVKVSNNMVTAGQARSIVRPGWEFNGSWYKWSAAGKAASYAGCFRHIVTAMRSVPGAAFAFDWNPNIGSGTFAAELAWPGSAYVNYIGVDVYDTSWTWYPTPAGVSTATAQDRAWTWILNQDHGLKFWATFAKARGKKLAITEWAATWRSDGHGGADNPSFIDHMLDFILDPANGLAYAHYFNSADTATSRHDIMRSDTAMPAAAAELRRRAAALTAATVTK